ncbi:MAG: hypothetical protein PGN08_09145 [Sphingomonas taxi]
MADREHRREQRQRRDHGEDDRQPPPRQPARQFDEDREGDVELLFDAQRPGVEQRPQFGFHREIAGLPPEPDVRREQQGGDRARRHRDEIVRQHDQRANHQHRRDHRIQRGQDALHPPFVETDDRIVLQQDRGDQEA